MQMIDSKNKSASQKRLGKVESKDKKKGVSKSIDGESHSEGEEQGTVNIGFKPKGKHEHPNAKSAKPLYFKELQDVMYVKHIKTEGSEFAQHLKFMSSIVFNDPVDLEGLFVYIQAKKHRERWLRVQIIRWDKKEKQFSCEYQNNTKTSKKLKLINESFVIDQTLQ